MDVSPRKELAAVAKKLGRDDEADHWESVVKGMSETSDQPAPRATRPVATPDRQKLILVPAEKQRPVTVPSAPAISNAKPEASNGLSKPCGDEQPADRKRREGESEKQKEKEKEKAR